MKCMQKVLLITDVPPCKNLSGGSMTLQLINFLLEEKHEVNIFLVSNPEVNYPIDETIKNSIKVFHFEKPQERWIQAKNPKYYRQIDNIKKELKKTVFNGQYNKIWGIIQGEVILELLDFCRKNIKIGYVCQIWDTINWWIKENNYSKIRADKVIKQYYDVIKGAECCITASWGMTEQLSKKWKNKYVELMPALDLHNINIDFEKDKDRFVIAMAGQVYAKQELDAFLSALDKLKWEINKKKIYFYHYGNFSNSYIDFQKHSAYSDRIIPHGFINQQVLTKIFNKVDLLYCPYFFSDNNVYKEISETSFPSKLINYLATKAPIVLHAPDYSSPTKFVKKYNCAYVINSCDTNEIVKSIKKITSQDSSNIVKNANIAYEKNFTKQVIKNRFLEAMNMPINYKNRKKILEVNNIDLSGRRFNGYDLLHYINEATNNICNQIVTYKQSNDYNVKKFYETYSQLEVEYRLLAGELSILSVHNILSLTSNILMNHEEFKNADLVHLHLVDNTKLSLIQLPELCSKKPTVITLHDPWWFTGRCVYPEECEKWKNGCFDCPRMDSLFTLPRDNSDVLWKLKKEIYKYLDVDIIVTTPYMTNLLNESPLTNFENVHVIPFGIDLDKFVATVSQEKAKEHFKIPKDNIVIFLRAQMAYKGTEYVDEAMKLLETNKKITLLTCSETHILDDLKNKYNVIDLGNIQDEEMHWAYTACDMFLMPSRGETFGLMAIEAMASSKPIIVFNNTALPYVTFAPECGVLVENKNSQKLMEAIQYLIENEEERIKRGNLGRKLCEEHYDIKKYHERILEVYEKAYERQKNKEVYEHDGKIDYNDPNVQHLIVKLSKIYKKMNFRTPLKSKSFRKKMHIVDNKNYKIDYSSNSVQNLIIEFNNYVYEVYQKEYVYSINESGNYIKPKIHDFVIIHKLKDRYYDKLKRHKTLFVVTRYLYRKTRSIVKYIRYGAQV